MTTSKKKELKLRYGGIKMLSDIFGVSTQTVRRAMKYEFDTALADQMRLKACTLNLVTNNRIKYKEGK